MSSGKRTSVKSVAVCCAWIAGSVEVEFEEVGVEIKGESSVRDRAASEAIRIWRHGLREWVVSVRKGGVQ